MPFLIQNIALQAQRTFKQGIQDQIFYECFIKLKEYIDILRPIDFNLNEEIFKVMDKGTMHAPIRYIDIFENHRFSMGVFILPRNGTIPLHNHPKMNGILKLLHGNAQINCYTRNAGNLLTDEMKKFQTANDLISVKAEDTIYANSQTPPCILDPINNNYHEIKAINGSAAFFDILAPPYNRVERDCSYYKLFDQSENIFLQEVSCPLSFQTRELKYRGPEIRLNELD